MSSISLMLNTSGQVATVDTFADLPPATAVPIGSERVTADNGTLYINDGAAWNATAGGGGISGGSNVGTGTGLSFKDVSGANLRFRSIAVTNHVQLGAGADTITLTTDATSAATASTLVARDGSGNFAAGTITAALNGNANNVTGVVAIANGGTGQSNQQAALNNLTDAGSHTNGDILQLLGGNAQFAAAPAPTYAQINTAIGAPANRFIFSNATSEIVGYNSWQIDPDTKASNVDITIQPNNLANAFASYSWNTSVDPLQNSPDDSLRLHSLNVNLDSTATGFAFGTNGQAATLIAGGMNYGGNGATFGQLRNINLFTGLGDGTNPGTFAGIAHCSMSTNVSANITLDGGVTGYDFNLNVNAAAITTSNFQILWMSDFSQIPVDLYGYQAVVCQPQIATIKTNHNFSGLSINPTITTMEGNAGYYGLAIGGTITTAGTGGVSGLSQNTNVTTLPATSSYNGITQFGQIGTVAATAQVYGMNLGTSVTTLTGNFYGTNISPQVAGGTGQVQLITGSMGAVTTTGDTSVLSLNGQTANGRQSSFSADGVRMNIGGTLTPLSAQSIQSQHVIFTSLAPSGGAITGTDILCNIFSPDVDFGAITDSIAIGPAGLGVAMVAFAGQTHGHGQMDLLSALIPTAIFQDDFTLGEWRNVNCNVINAGFTGTVTNATAFYHEVTGAGLFATNHWGLRVVTDMDNFVTKMAVNTSSQKVTNASVGIELGGTDRAVLVSRLTSAQEGALTAVNGMIIYNTDTNKFRGYEAGAWTDLI